MRLLLTLLLIACTAPVLFGQQTDTLTFYSQAFQQQRTVHVHVPEFYAYRSDAVQLPVIYVLDGQHEWFAVPVLTTIRYLQYTHELPEALVVVIPLADRMAECGIDSLNAPLLPLHRFITEELEVALKNYGPIGHRTVIGHSFSASFALYSHLQAPSFYAAVIAHSPLDHMERLVRELSRNSPNFQSRIFLSIGGPATDKDGHHRKVYDRLKGEYPAFFRTAHTFEAHLSAHNAVPIVATPTLLTQVFEDFRGRYARIAEVDETYQLIAMPQSVAEEMDKIDRASTLGSYHYAAELPDINGIASRYQSSGLNAYAMAVYELGVRNFPNYYEFHLALYELYLPTDATRAEKHLTTATQLLRTMERNLPEQQELLQEIDAERKKNGR